MCGITGFWRNIQGGQDQNGLHFIATTMANTLTHRGPNDVGVWTDSSIGLAFGHRRLSVVDLSPAGHQPMVSRSGRYVLVFNGEIYNHLILRGDLEKLKHLNESKAGILHGQLKSALGQNYEDQFWHGHSDTETLLAGFEAWGVEQTLCKTIGMFAIAVWDKQDQSLSLARDRMGEKPLYYGWVNGTFIFGSEIKALKAYPGFHNPVCRQALTQYLRFMYVPAPRSIYQGIYKLEPGCILKIEKDPPSFAPNQPLRPETENNNSHGNLNIHRWWSLAEVAASGSQKLVKGESQALGELESLLREAVNLQTLSDVPLGAFLSGGVDSSTIVALMQQQSSRPVKTFTIGFSETDYDESSYARAVAKHLGTDHHELNINAQMAQAIIPSLPEMYDEPFADSSQIPTHLVSKLARENVTVALSGDAGDELFGGYNRYLIAPPLWKKLSLLPFAGRKILGRGLASVPESVLSTAGSKLLNGRNGVVRLGEKVHNMAERLRCVQNFDDLSLSLLSNWSNPSELVIDELGESVNEPPSLLSDPLPWLKMDQSLAMMYRDSMTYLPDDILCKVDRAAMACSLETRVPFLDHRVVELAWQMPTHMKVRGNVGKWALREVLYKYVPKELVERPKAGFAIPIGQWLRGPLRDWAECLITENRLRSEGFLQPEPIRRVWAEHLGGMRDHTSKLWAILMFQAWLEKNQ
jgi:asparagine synthase (glutamine-hydrolysing)